MFLSHCSKKKGWSGTIPGFCSRFATVLSVGMLLMGLSSPLPTTVAVQHPQQPSKKEQRNPNKRRCCRQVPVPMNIAARVIGRRGHSVSIQQVQHSGKLNVVWQVCGLTESPATRRRAATIAHDGCATVPEITGAASTSNQNTPGIGDMYLYI